MSSLAMRVAIIVTLLLVLLIKIEGNSNSVSIQSDEMNTKSMSNIVGEEVGEDYPRSLECSIRPWICNIGEFSPRSICCRNRCADLTSDSFNCGFCGLICPYNLRCCNRLCVNTYISPFNCAGCGRICPIGRFCSFGARAFENPSIAPLPPPSKIHHPTILEE
ncbi:unnamed protein product [Lathyrus oleraceus]|uniref:stigma-specific STIG1-like protein 4 n=1 Tax=Pisum sativum TaxID=3888 RepID=UPI0021D017A6|nr:stigma-specific STIG1-like protein 4 [Pisum sativum]